MLWLRIATTMHVSVQLSYKHGSCFFFSGERGQWCWVLIIPAGSTGDEAGFNGLSQDARTHLQAMPQPRGRTDRRTVELLRWTRPRRADVMESQFGGRDKPDVTRRPGDVIGDLRSIRRRRHQGGSVTWWWRNDDERWWQLANQSRRIHHSPALRTAVINSSFIVDFASWVGWQ